jgi:hypothetical protein
MDASNLLKPRSPAASCTASARPRSTSTASTWRRTRPGPPLPAGLRERAHRGGHGVDPARLKEKYEQHHGVRITDSALVAAATLSNRYITDRFLPDKAIDLVDEAARACACRSIRSPKNSTTSTARSCA